MVFFETIALASTYLSVWLLHLWRGELVPERCMQWPARRAGTAQEQRRQRSQLTEQDTQTDQGVVCLLLRQRQRFQY